MCYSTKVGSSLAHNYKTRVEVTGVTNTLAYNDTELITEVKCFIVQAPGGLPQSGVRNVTLLRLALALPTTIKQEWK